MWINYWILLTFSILHLFQGVERKYDNRCQFVRKGAQVTELSPRALLGKEKNLLPFLLATAEPKRGCSFPLGGAAAQP